MAPHFTTSVSSVPSSTSIATNSKKRFPVPYQDIAPKPKRSCIRSAAHNHSSGCVSTSRRLASSQALQSPTRQSMFHIYTKTPTNRASIVKKRSETNINEGTETILYTIAITKPLPTPPGQKPKIPIIYTKENKNNIATSVKEAENLKEKPNEPNVPQPSSPDACTLDVLTEVASDVLQKEKEASFQSVERSNLQFRVKTLSKGKPNTTGQANAATRKFSFIFK